MQVIGKWKEFQCGRLDVWLEAALATTGFAVEGGVGLKAGYFAIQSLKDLLDGEDFFG